MTVMMEAACGAKPGAVQLAPARPAGPGGFAGGNAASMDASGAGSGPMAGALLILERA